MGATQTLWLIPVVIPAVLLSRVALSLGWVFVLLPRGCRPRAALLTPSLTRGQLKPRPALAKGRGCGRGRGTSKDNADGWLGTSRAQVSSNF